MPSIAQEEWDIPSMDFHMSPNGAVNLLKRRRDVANFADVMDEEMQMKINSPRHSNLHSHPHPHNLYPHAVHHESERRHLIPRSKMSLNKRVRVEYLPSEPESRIEQTKEKEKSGSGMDLRACHICRRKPTVMKELDAFANCEGCGKRACWVCIRECLGGWGNTEMGEEVGGKEGWGEKGMTHRGMICSRCCVERGTEGDVLCLGCLRMEGS
ncbi:hypothetical protein BOTCAL_0131g00170 [Botryotinia calthae]|uniref:Uncharacterized protein n=1 Tax=Botryotinia calthae TaxID=38488 RepID=A0A4Y8D5Y9_9HELO|nr:hypothetical protein BOTCAL_0131g00170 [Botryotinia calthae]